MGSEASVREDSGAPDGGHIVVLPVIRAVAGRVRRSRHLVYYTSRTTKTTSTAT